MFGFGKDKTRTKVNKAFDIFQIGSQVGIIGGQVMYGGKKFSAAECDAWIDDSRATKKRTTATRVVTGFLAAGPVGTVVGAVAKKDVGTVTLHVITPAGTASQTYPAKKAEFAHGFVRNLRGLRLAEGGE